MKTLADAEPGFAGTVHQLAGAPHLVERLAEVGIHPGDPIELKGIMAFGDPFIVHVKGTSFALRRDEARCIHV